MHALFNRETLLDLQPDRSVVRNLLKEGVEVYLVDWGSPTRKDRFLTLDDHINGYLDNMVDFIRRRHRLPQVNLMGVCMGGTFGVIYAALHPEKVKNLITTVAPTHFDTDKGLLHIWLKEIDVDRLVDTFGNLPGNLLNIGLPPPQSGPAPVRQVRGLSGKHGQQGVCGELHPHGEVDLRQPGCPRRDPAPADQRPLPANLLIKGEMELGGRRVDLGRLTMPLLNIYGQYDHLVPPEACQLLTRKVGSRDTEDICLDTGHVGIYVSSRFQKELVPRIASWLLARDG